MLTLTIVIGILRLALFFRGLPQDVREKVGDALDKARDAKAKTPAEMDPFDMPE